MGTRTHMCCMCMYTVCGIASCPRLQSDPDNQQKIEFDWWSKYYYSLDDPRRTQQEYVDKGYDKLQVRETYCAALLRHQQTLHRVACTSSCLSSQPNSPSYCGLGSLDSTSRLHPFMYNHDEKA